MQLQASLAALSLALTAFAVEASVPVTIYNQCSESIDLYDNSATETVAAGGSTSRTLADGYSGMLRNGASSQATRTSFGIWV
jgi:predicted porin